MSKFEEGEQQQKRIHNDIMAIDLFVDIVTVDWGTGTFLFDHPLYYTVWAGIRLHNEMMESMKNKGRKNIYFLSKTPFPPIPARKKVRLASQLDHYWTFFAILTD